MALYTARLTEHLTAVEQVLTAALPVADSEVSVAPLMAYACEGGGKRIRPVLLLEFCRLCGGDTERALPFAAAIEFIHSYSLVHDDLPCMDNSALRRGKPSVHAAYGETMALLAGDALLNRAFEVMLSPEAAKGMEAAALRAAYELADKAGIHGMIGGQVLDLASEGKTIDLATLQALQEGKTAALLTAACRMGAILGGGNEEQIQAAGEYGYYVGLCFQIVDDILDVTATAEELGKPVGSDTENEKSTYVSLLGLEEARCRAAAYTEKAKEALSVFSEQRADLCELADALLVRSH
ncbi:MAG: polyprenyl synthetase family protein [Clostridia bacterium]|nr:polyprenyl synthetase family protein [Clostridia bacterium]